MAPATLRRHLAVLVEAGLVLRRDSPNGKRYARKSPEGDVEQAFGFDLAPLRSRAGEFATLADTVRADERARRVAREQISLLRRDIAKILEAAAEAGTGVDIDAMTARYAAFAGLQPRRMELAALEDAVGVMKGLAEELFRCVSSQLTANMSASESHNERHIQNSNPETPYELEPRIRKMQAEPSQPAPRPSGADMFPLGFVLSVCPSLSDYSRTGIGSWSEFMATAAFVRPMLGISPSAWEEAEAAMGPRQAAIVIAAMLERSDAITNAGGYLRSLSRKAAAGGFSVGPMVMALAGRRRKESKRA
jgi:replication initiation protein RepC